MSSSSESIKALQQAIDTALESGDVAKAMDAANHAVGTFGNVAGESPENLPPYIEVLEIRGDFLRTIGLFQEAKTDYEVALDLLERSPAKLPEQEAKLRAALGAAFDGLGDIERATEEWEKSVTAFEGMDPPAAIDAATMLNNLAYLAKSHGDFAEAEKHFLRALATTTKELGRDHPFTALVSDNLGVLYQAMKRYEQAREMHILALEARNKTLGFEHPNAAESHNHLAMALAATKNYDLAYHHFDQALEILGPYQKTLPDELETVVGNFVHFLRKQGENEEAAKIASRYGFVEDEEVEEVKATA